MVFADADCVITKITPLSVIIVAVCPEVKANGGNVLPEIWNIKLYVDWFVLLIIPYNCVMLGNVIVRLVDRVPDSAKYV